jgi:hypothetical protein
MNDANIRAVLSSQKKRKQNTVAGFLLNTFSEETL